MELEIDSTSLLSLMPSHRGQARDVWWRHLRFRGTARGGMWMYDVSICMYIHANVYISLHVDILNV